MPAPGKTKLIKFPPSRAGRTSNARGVPRGDVEADTLEVNKGKGEQLIAQ